MTGIRMQSEKRSTKPSRKPRAATREKPARAREIGGPAGPEPTRYGDWERKGRCIDF